MKDQHLHEVREFLRMQPVIQVLDDLDIGGCPACEMLRFQIIEWVQAHSPDVQKQQRAWQEMIAPMLSVPRKKGLYVRRKKVPA